MSRSERGLTMKCKKCETELDLDTMKVRVDDCDPEMLDMQIQCPCCGARRFTFVRIDDFIGDDAVEPVVGGITEEGKR